jgi:hypothetical protein
MKVIIRIISISIIVSTLNTSPIFCQNIDFGNYYALLIANQQYNQWRKLDTPYEDVKSLKSILENRYGFKTNVLLNATHDQIIDKLEWYRKYLTSHDNLLIYYAGHGKLRKDGGYWIGVDGDKESRSKWVHYRTISELIDSGNDMRALHVLIIVDGCYGGAIMRGEDDDRSKRLPNETDRNWYLRMNKTPSRRALTSGGTEPVIDKVGKANHSIFAHELINQLQNNTYILEASSLFDMIKKDVHARARRIVGNDAQAPEYAPIPGTGDMGGDFLFVPKDIVMPIIPMVPEVNNEPVDLGIRGDGSSEFNTRQTNREAQLKDFSTFFGISHFSSRDDIIRKFGEPEPLPEITRKLRKKSGLPEEVPDRSYTYFEECLYLDFDQKNNVETIRLMYDYSVSQLKSLGMNDAKLDYIGMKQTRIESILGPPMDTYLAEESQFKIIYYQYNINIDYYARISFHVDKYTNICEWLSVYWGERLW